MSKYYYNTTLRTLQSALKVLGFQDEEIPKLVKIDELELGILVKDMYRKRAFETHPDRNPTDGREFIQLPIAYKRAKYLIELHHHKDYRDVMCYCTERL